MQKENNDFLTTQILTYLGNKRSLIGKIEIEIKEIIEKLGKEKAVCADLFSGSGIVARMLKQYSSKVIVNDLENYSAMVNSCYLTNKKDYPEEVCSSSRAEIINRANKNKIENIISNNYAPKNDDDIKAGERVFLHSFKCSFD